MHTTYGICPLCYRVGILHRSICKECTEELVQLQYATIGDHQCPLCLSPQLHPDTVCLHERHQGAVLSVFPHRRRAKQLITRFERDDVKPLHTIIAYHVEQVLTTLPERYSNPLLIPVPYKDDPMKQVVHACHQFPHLHLLHKKAGSYTLCQKHITSDLTGYTLIALAGSYKNGEHLNAAVTVLRSVITAPIIALCITKD